MTGAPAPRVSPDRAPQHGLMRAWTVSVSWGELAGFCVPALVGGLLREEPPLLVLGAMVLAGSVAWLIGTSPSTVHEQWSTWPTAVVALAGAVVGALALSVIGIGQWLDHRGPLDQRGSAVGGLALG